MERLTLEEAIKYIKEVVCKNRKNKEKNTIVIPNRFISSADCAEKYEQVAKWLKELKSYKEAEEQGLLVRLPCKVGDTVWDNDFGYPKSYEIKAFSYGYCDSYVEPGIGIEDEIIFYYENYTRSITGAFPMSEIGKTVFLTREEAEKKLEEMRKWTFWILQGRYEEGI